jgi:hypothetical protein
MCARAFVCVCVSVMKSKSFRNLEVPVKSVCVISVCANSMGRILDEVGKFVFLVGHFDYQHVP